MDRKLTMLLLLMTVALCACSTNEELTPTPAAAVEETSDQAPTGLDVGSDLTYRHPSGRFSLNKLSSQYQESDSGVVFLGEGAKVMVITGWVTETLTSQGAIDLADEMARAYLSQTAESYTTYPEKAQEYKGGFRVTLEYEGGGGEIYLVQDENQYYAMVLLASDYAVSEEQWLGAIDSLTY